MNYCRHLTTLIVLFLGRFTAAFIFSCRNLDLSRRFQLKLQGSLSSEAVVDSYVHRNWKLTYIFKQASSGYESSSPVLLIHPVGIGLSSWFWTKFLEEWKEGPAFYAIDLNGCGLEHGADPWNPDERGMFFPLSWVESCETLIHSIMLPRVEKVDVSHLAKPSCIVITQGGIAPVGVMLAYRNPTTVAKLILASPPKWNQMIHPIPEEELKRNYDLLRLPLIGSILFDLLETRFPIRLFSNLFLFADECDERWLHFILASGSISNAAREPIRAFNAGLLNHRSYEHELTNLVQPILVVTGNKDKRQEGRFQFKAKMRDCTLVTTNGLNVIPWENAADFKVIAQAFALNSPNTTND